MWLGWEGWAVSSELMWPQMEHRHFTPYTPKLAPRKKGSPFPGCTAVGGVVVPTSSGPYSYQTLMGPRETHLVELVLSPF